MQELRPPIQYGCFLRWPEDSDGFIHPDDKTVAIRTIPSGRVLRRFHFDGTYYHYQYGQQVRFRLRPAMWLKVQHEGLDIGDQVETEGPQIEREQLVARIWGMHWVPRKGRILYRLQSGRGDPVPKLYVREELKLLTDKHQLKPGSQTHPEPSWHGKRPTLSIEDDGDAGDSLKQP